MDILKTWFLIITFQYNKHNECVFAALAWAGLFVFLMSFYVAYSIKKDHHDYSYRFDFEKSLIDQVTDKPLNYKFDLKNNRIIIYNSKENTITKIGIDW